MQFELSSDYHLDHQIYFLGTLIGEIYQGSRCTINYRIHDGNQVGISLGFWSRFKNFVQIFRKLDQIRVQQLALRKIFLQVSENVFQGSLSSPGLHFTAVCNRSVIVRLNYFFNPQFRRQNRFDQTLFRLIFIMLT